MSGPDPSNQTLINWLLGALWSALLACFGVFTVSYREERARLMTKIETLERSDAHLAATTVTRFELQKHMDDLRIEFDRSIDRLHDDRVRMHAENINRFDHIDAAVQRVHARIDNRG